MSKLAQDIKSVGAELFEGRLAQDINSVDAELVQETTVLSLTAPANGQTGVALSMTFSWTDSESRGLYRLLYDTDINFGNPTEVWTEATSYNATLTSGTYYWKVEAHNTVQQDAFVEEGGVTGMTVWDANTDPAPIYVYDNGGTAIPRVLEAANDLSGYIAESSGKTAPTVAIVSESFSFPQRCIKIGFPNALTQREEIQIKCSDGGPLELTGKDVFDPANPNFIDQVTETNYMQQAGTYHAVMTFMQENMGIVWGWIGDLGEAVPSLSELNVDVVDKTHTPSCISRQHLRNSEAGYESNYGVAKQWQRRQRNFYSLVFNTGHELKPFYRRYHPDSESSEFIRNEQTLFALQLDATRDGFPYGEEAKLEVGDPELDNLLATEFYPSLRNVNPLKEAFGCGANDGYFEGHSRDPRALEMDYRDPSYTPRFTYQYRTGSVSDVPITDRTIVFANRVLARLRQESGFENAFVNTDAYGPTRWEPQETFPDDGVFISNVANEFSDPNYSEGSITGRTHAENLDAWLAVVPQNQLWRPNIGRGYGHGRGMPMCQVSRIGTRFKQIVGQGVTGFLPDRFWEHWATQWPMYYVMSQLMWDHTQSVSTIMDKAYNTLFGDAATHIKDYYQTIEIYLNNNFQHTTGFAEIAELYDTQTLNTWQGYIDSALASVDPASVEYERVEFVQAGLTWMKRMAQSCRYFVQYNALASIVNQDNLADGSNAIEDDTDSTSGWTSQYTAFTFTSQSAETNGSNFAFLLDGDAPGTETSKGITRTAPLASGTSVSGTATSGTVSSLTETGKGLTVDEHAGRTLRITSGTNAGEQRGIQSNTSDTIVLSAEFNTPIDNTSVYEIVDMYVVTIDAKHTGVGSSWRLRVLDESSFNTDVLIQPDDTEWDEYSILAYGGDQILIRDSGPPRNGKIYVDNLQIKQAVPVDKVGIANEWTAWNADAIAELGVQDGNQFVYIDKWSSSPPIGYATLNPNGSNHLPTPNSADVTDPTAGLE